ncbi:MAG: 4-alpha-glucanotransferase [Acidimicrobiales bacterium]|nr:4-alpha-glucanotransferase [Acidimicrobiales bacterium]
MTADRWGIEDGYWDAGGTWHDADPATTAALREAVGWDPAAEGPPEPEEPCWFVRAGHAAPLHGRVRLELEDGTDLTAAGDLPPDLPLGYHRLVPLDGAPPTRLVVTPGRCHLPPDLRAWGWAVQLYAARSRRSWGIGDLADLAELGRWSRDLGAQVLILNPLHADAPVHPQQPSPYYPTSRRFRNVQYLRIEDVPGAGEAAVDLDALAAAGRALLADRHIDRDAIYRLKRTALDRIWETAGPRRGRSEPRAFRSYRAAQGTALRQYTTFCAIAEVHGGGYHGWPAELQRPDSPAVARFARARADRVRFHAWCQWLLDEQLARASAHVGVVQDLAVGFDPGGADAWAWQDLLAPGVSVGAPPDEFNTRGQDWGLPPFVPWRLRNAGYLPFIETVRAVLRHAGGMRVDHVMGLFRLYWIPPGGRPADGTYVRYPAGDLLDLLALESERAGAVVVGEDLGTVEDEVRAELAGRHLLSYRLVWFEPGPPATYPGRALAAVTTHDLPTVAGLVSGSDLAVQLELGLEPNVTGTTAMQAALRSAAAVPDDRPLDHDLDAVVVSVHRQLAESPPAIVTATLEDVLRVEERPNLPGTIDEWPNWRLALPDAIEDVMADPFVLEVARALDEGRRDRSGDGA